MMKSKRNLCFFVLIVMTVVLFSGCIHFSNSATIEVENATSMEEVEVTVDGVEKIISSGETDTWTVDWTGSSDYKVSMEAKTLFGTFASKSLTVKNDKHYKWHLSL